MQRLIDGLHRFRSEKFGRYKALFRRLAREGQRPHTLFVTCSDSRVLAELVTQSQPGDLFVVKNAGNIIPPSSVTGSTNSTAAAIEFAVCALEVQDIVVCGHSQCGAMTALFEDPRVILESMPHLHAWLTLAHPVRDLIRERYADRSLADQATAAAEENVLFALENLSTYPAVEQRLASGSLHLHGWFFQIATAEMFAYEPDQRQFVRIENSPS